MRIFHPWAEYWRSQSAHFGPQPDDPSSHDWKTCGCDYCASRQSDCRQRYEELENNLSVAKIRKNELEALVAVKMSSLENADKALQLAWTRAKPIIREARKHPHLFSAFRQASFLRDNAATELECAQADLSRAIELQESIFNDASQMIADHSFLQRRK